MPRASLTPIFGLLSVFQLNRGRDFLQATVARGLGCSRWSKRRCQVLGATPSAAVRSKLSYQRLLTDPSHFEYRGRSKHRSAIYKYSLRLSREAPSIRLLL